jgi:hypothetical protein
MQEREPVARERVQQAREREQEALEREREELLREQSRRKRAKNRVTTATQIAKAALAGAIIGVGYAAVGHADISSITSKARDFAVSAGLARARAPQSGDYWLRCDAARTAGTTPIYRGEPGYRDALDADGDGIACEPYRADEG